MGYKTFIGSTTLSIATMIAMSPSAVDDNIENELSIAYEKPYKTSQGTGGTYTPVSSMQVTSDWENLMVLASFANNLLSENKFLENDISELIDDNIMDLLS